MIDGQQTTDESQALRWGGLAGILGSILLLIVFWIVATYVGMEPVDPVAELVRFPAIHTPRIVENGLYLLVLILWVAHFLAIYRALRSTHPGAALLGSVLGVLGLVVLAAGALPHIATAPISDFYHVPGATPAQQDALVLIWQATQGLFDALLVVGLLFLPLGLLCLGGAMLGNRAFGGILGAISIGLGGVGLLVGVFSLVDVSAIAAAGIFAQIFFHLILGWKVYRLSNLATR